MTTATLLAMTITGPLIGAWLVPRRTVTRVLLGISILVVVLLTLVPTDRHLELGCTIDWAIPTLGKVELVANVILFAPVALLAGILTRRPLPTLLVASGASALVELVQAFATVLGRSCSTNDWLANTIGATFGALLAAAALLLARKINKPPAAAKSP